MANDVQQESLVLAETFERHWEQLKGITNNVRVLENFYSNCLHCPEIIELIFSVKLQCLL